MKRTANTETRNDHLLARNMESPPAWLSKLFGYSVHELKAACPRGLSVLIQGKGKHGSGLIELIPLKSGLAAFRLSKGADGRLARLPLSQLELLDQESRMAANRFANRMLFFWKKQFGDEDDSPQGHTLRALQLLISPESYRRPDEVKVQLASLFPSSSGAKAAAQFSGGAKKATGQRGVELEAGADEGVRGSDSALNAKNEEPELRDSLKNVVLGHGMKPGKEQGQTGQQRSFQTGTGPGVHLQNGAARQQKSEQGAVEAGRAAAASKTFSRQRFSSSEHSPEEEALASGRLPELGCGPWDDEIAKQVEFLSLLFRGEWEQILAEELSPQDGIWKQLILQLLSGDFESIRHLAKDVSEGATQGPLSYVVGNLLAEAGFLEAAAAALERVDDRAFSQRLFVHLGRILRQIGQPEAARDWLVKVFQLPDATPRLHYRACRELILCGAFEDARRGLEFWCRPERRAELKSPAGRKMAFLLADLHLWANQTEEARRILELIQDLAGDETEFLRLEGSLLAIEQDWEEARLRLESAVKQSPDDSVAQLWLAEALLRLGRTGEAKEPLHMASVELGMTPQRNLLFEVFNARNNKEPSVLTTPVVEGLGGSAELSTQGPLAWEKELFRVLQRLGGQRGELAVVHDPELAEQMGLRLYEYPEVEQIQFSRARSGDLLKRLGRIPTEELLKEFDVLIEKHPTSPHPHCYKGELMLWLGEYDEAYLLFDQALRRRQARWAYVGRAAVHILRGEHELAEIQWNAVSKKFTPVLGATTEVYRGESARMQGKWDQARHHLEEAIRAKPGRIGARINLALTHLGAGEREKALAMVEELERWMPRLFWDATEAALGKATWPVPREGVEEVLLAALRLMRGNRSSHLVSYFDTSGKMRLFPSRQQGAEMALNFIPVIAEELLAQFLWGVNGAQPEDVALSSSPA